MFNFVYLKKYKFMKKAIILGASGLTGKELIGLLHKDKRYSRIILLVRKELNINLPKTEQLLFDFDNLIPDNFTADEMYCCLGTTIKKAGSKEEFEKVDYDYVSKIAGIAHINGIKSFAVVSSMGANINSKIFYSKVKGKMEEAVKRIGFEKCCIVRPSLILGKRSEFRFGEAFAKIFMLSFSFLIPHKYKAVSAKKIAMSMINTLNDKNKGLTVLESDQIYKTKLIDL